MPLKLHVGVCRKVGLPQYGSVSASCSAEVELPDQTLDNHDAFQRHARDAYKACEKAVEEQLSDRQVAGCEENCRTTASTPVRQNGNGTSGPRPATEKQMQYLSQLATRIEGLGVRRLDTLTEKVFGVPVAALSSFDASKLIDLLKKAQAGEADLQAVLDGE